MLFGREITPGMVRLEECMIDDALLTCSFPGTTHAKGHRHRWEVLRRNNDISPTWWIILDEDGQQHPLAITPDKPYWVEWTCQRDADRAKAAFEQIRS